MRARDDLGLESSITDVDGHGRQHRAASRRWQPTPASAGSSRMLLAGASRAAKLRAVLVRAMLWLAAWVPSGDGIDVRWDAPLQCPDAEDVRGWMNDDDIVARAPVAVEARIEAVQDGFSLSLAIDGPSGATQRRLAHRSCEELARAAVLIIAVAADPLRSLSSTSELVVVPTPAREPDATPPAPRATSPAPTTDALDPPADRAPASSIPLATTRRTVRRRPWFGVGAEAGVAWGLAPPATGSLGGAIALGARRWQVALGALHTFAAPARFADLPRVGADISTTRAALRGCGRIAAGRVAFLPCGGVELGATRGDGVGLPTTQTRSAAWVALTVHAMVELVLARRVALWVAPNLVVPMTRPAFSVRGREDSVWRTPRLTGGLSMGVQLRFGAVREPPWSR
ncbi:MAG: hypothetical protein IPK74_35070 [Deltaproteobacteria bacterium]|nr:hypothetical protein [Deltaproteobacteria bacterium]